MDNPPIDTKSTPANSNARPDIETAQSVTNQMRGDDWLDEQKPVGNKTVETAFNEMVTKLGIIPKPMLIAIPTDDNPHEQLAAAQQTKSGRTYVMIDVTKGVSNEDMTAILAHELGHIAKGHTRPEVMAGSMTRDNEVNSQVQPTLSSITTAEQLMAAIRLVNPESKREEREADAVAAELCQGFQSANMYQRALDTARFTLPTSLRIPGLTVDQSIIVSDPMHPPVPERIQNLREGAKANEVIGNCSAPTSRGR